MSISVGDVESNPEQVGSPLSVALAKPVRRYGFQKGVSGNPGGRPKELTEVRNLARRYTADAVAALVKIVRNPKAGEAAKVAAAQAILDRAWGKPVQASELLGPDGKPVDPRMQIAFVIEK